jgi:hypothetical protein
LSYQDSAKCKKLAAASAANSVDGGLACVATDILAVSSTLPASSVAIVPHNISAPVTGQQQAEEIKVFVFDLVNYLFLYFYFSVQCALML